MWVISRRYYITEFVYANMQTLRSSMCKWRYSKQLQLRHKGRDSVWNNQPHDCFLNSLFRHRSKKTSYLRVTGLCAGNSPEAGEFPAQMASNAKKCFHLMTSPCVTFHTAVIKIIISPLRVTCGHCFLIFVLKIQDPLQQGRHISGIFKCIYFYFYQYICQLTVSKNSHWFKHGLVPYMWQVIPSINNDLEQGGIFAPLGLNGLILGAQLIVLGTTAPIDPCLNKAHFTLTHISYYFNEAHKIFLF